MKQFSDAESVKYMAALARELSKIAMQANRPFLAYLLSLVIAEAERE